LNNSKKDIILSQIEILKLTFIHFFDLLKQASVVKIDLLSAGHRFVNALRISGREINKKKSLKQFQVVVNPFSSSAKLLS